MANTVTVSPDGFSAALNGMLAQIADGIGEGLEPVTRDATRLAQREAKSGAKALEPTMHRKFVNSLTYTVKRKADGVTGEVGSKKYPGLVHLTEKGHATIGGGRTRAFKYMDAASQVAFPAYQQAVEELVSEVLAG